MPTHQATGCSPLLTGGILRAMHDAQRRVAGSVDDLLAGARARTPLRHDDSKSGALFEEVTHDGAVLMRDVGPYLVPAGHAAPAPALPRPHGAPARALPETVRGLLADPGPLLRALEATPQTLVHGDWKAGNLGVAADGRTILLDWAIPGAAPPCSDLAWYLALNARRLPQRREEVIAGYRRALEGHGIATHPRFPGQMALCLLGVVVQFGWEKALGDDAEQAWWEQRAMDAAPLLS